MYCVRNVTEDLFWVGGTDRRLALFENVYPIPEGVSYNAYVLLDDKTALFDTVDRSVSEVFFENVEYVLGERTLDVMIINHMEPDHSAVIREVIRRYPDVTVVTNAKIRSMMEQFFDLPENVKFEIVKEGDQYSTGKHTYTFVNAPMVHWPEVMFTYDINEGILFSADAFGTFGAMNGNLFADELDFEKDYLESARRYYTNIVGKYGPQVTAVLKKASTIDIKMICPLHGPIWRENIGWFLGKYVAWSSYEPEEKEVFIPYASIYGHTENAVNVIAAKLGELGVRNIRMMDVSVTDPSYALAEAFKASHLIIAAPTYNNEIFSKMETFLTELVEHNFQNRTVAVLDNGTWAPQAGKKIREVLGKMKNMTILDTTVSIKSAPKEEQREALEAIAVAVAESLK